MLSDWVIANQAVGFGRKVESWLKEWIVQLNQEEGGWVLVADALLLREAIASYFQERRK